jgi:hypothetical protein
MDVADWRDSPPLVTPKNRAPRRFLSPTFVGVLGTVLLHTAFIQALPFGSRGTKVRVPEAQESASALAKFEVDSAESLVLIPLTTMANAPQAVTGTIVSSLPDLAKMKIKSPVNVDPPALLNIETLALGEERASKSAPAAADGAERARLFGVYTGQIQARIERVWRRPRTPVNEGSDGKLTQSTGESFQCEAQVVQDEAGNVQEILLPRCNRSVAWQRSLVLAIRQASPLPAPPSASVFMRSITLNFVGLAFVPGGAEDDYEIEARKLARADVELGEMKALMH